jgi:hypothetical protein
MVPGNPLNGHFRHYLSGFCPLPRAKKLIMDSDAHPTNDINDRLPIIPHKNVAMLIAADV